MDGAPGDAGVAEGTALPGPPIGADGDGGMGEALATDGGDADSDGGAEAAEAPADYLHGDHLTTEWGGARAWLASHGVTFDLVYAARCSRWRLPSATPLPSSTATSTWR